MDLCTKVELRYKMESHPKAKPLAERLIAEAVQQGATLGDFKVATELALEILKEEMNPNLVVLKGLEGRVSAALERI